MNAPIVIQEASAPVQVIEERTATNLVQQVPATNIVQQVPVAQKLVGGTAMEEVVTVEQKHKHRGLFHH